MSTDVTASEQRLSAHVAEEIRALMGRREISKTELARRLGVSDMWVGRRLRRQLPFDLDDLQRIAAVLGVNVSDLLPKANTFWKTREPLGERVVATVGEARIPRQRPHRPGRPVRQTRPVDQMVRPVTAVTSGR
jgi:transcriptional regulator with XRE-family HTH domain